jgi:nitroimidazol reductase NimA-like FMN-containing flavoprotein (pyridoxamine 5'-phosphate oxidase superfamily)
MAHHLRRKDREITDRAEIDRILGGARYATVALVDEGAPYVVTLSCGYDAERQRLCFHVATAGRKLDAIAGDSRACVSVIEDLGYNPGACEHPFRSVVMEGRMRVLEDLGEAREAMRTLIAQLESTEATDEIWERNKLAGDERWRGVRMLAFDIESICAKQGK